MIKFYEVFMELLDLLDSYWLTDKLIATVKDLAHEYFTLGCDLWSESFVTNSLMCAAASVLESQA